jgi:uncharacterized protein
MSRPTRRLALRCVALLLLMSVSAWGMTCVLRWHRSQELTRELMSTLDDLGRNGTVRRLIEQGADPRASGSDGKTALMVAAQFGDLKLARLVLQRGVNAGAIDLRGRNALMYAVAGIDGDVFYDFAPRIPTSGGAVLVGDPNFGEGTVLSSDTSGVVRLLLAAGADPEARDLHGRSAMHLARTWAPDLLPVLRTAGAPRGKRW